MWRLRSVSQGSTTSGSGPPWAMPSSGKLDQGRSRHSLAQRPTRTWSPSTRSDLERARRGGPGRRQLSAPGGTGSASSGPAHRAGRATSGYGSRLLLQQSPPLVHPAVEVIPLWLTWRTYVHTVQMNYEWDQAKAAANLAKHGVRLADAVIVFSDRGALTIDDPHPDDERHVTIGIDARARVLVVIWTWRGEETIRLISARRATPTERRQYARGEP
jgi:uncharacterized protein